MFAAQESIRLGAEIDLDQFHRSLLAEPEADAVDGTRGVAPEGADAPVGIG
jgi:hypothetical protein